MGALSTLYLVSEAPDVRLTATLNEAERARAEAYRDARAAAQFVQGRSLLRWALGGWLGIEPAAVRLETEPKGRLRVAHDDPLSCSVAHTEGLVAVLVSPMRCGVDVERSDRRVRPERLARRVLSADERQAWSGSAHELLRLWTLKEAYLKGTGEGLSVPMSQVSFELGSAITGRRGGELVPWRFASELTRTGHWVSAAVAAREAGLTVRWCVGSGAGRFQETP